MRLTITMQGQPPQEQTIRSSASIGRAVDNTICINDPSVARYHAMIELRSSGFFLTDLGSANGTTINGKPLIAEHALQRGDAVTLGGGTLMQVLEVDAATANASPVASVAHTPAPPTPVAHAGTETGLSPATLLVAGFTVLIVIGAVAAVLLVWRNSRQETVAATPAPTVAFAPTISVRPTDTPKALPPAPSGATERIAQNVRLLERAISGKSYYVFEPAMLEQIAAQTRNYVIDVSADAQNYKLLINQNFSNTNGLNPLYGYVLALSRSRFGHGGGTGEIGVWQVPANIAKDYVRAGESLASLNEPKRSAEVAAAHLKVILTNFDTQDFLYAIACYGLPEADAGNLRSKLERLDSPDARRNFWQMVKQGTVSPEGAERAIRFLAAGIVGENPQDYGLSAPPFSQLQ